MQFDGAQQEEEFVLFHHQQEIWDPCDYKSKLLAFFAFNSNEKAM